jgi:subtilisin-like proprotein convertase family protein
MHHISSTLATLVLREAAKARLSEPIRGCPKEFEDAVYRELAELHRTRPRLVAFTPTEALKRVLALFDVRRCLGSHAERQPAPSRLTVTARGMAAKIALGALAATLATSTGAPAFAGRPHQDRHSHSAQQQKQGVSAAGQRRGNKTKTIRKTFSSDDAIAIPKDETGFTDPADPFPSTIAVGGFKRARIADVNLTLRGLSHPFPADIDVLLVAPGGRNAVLVDEAGRNSGGEPAITDITLTLDDDAPTELPENNALTTGAFQPFVFDLSSVEFPAPAPTPSGEATLSTFDGINPNGQWQLFIVDDAGGDTGSLADGWTLEITAKSKGKNKGKRKR